jgi:hypothetical protein
MGLLVCSFALAGRTAWRLKMSIDSTAAFACGCVKTAASGTRCRVIDYLDGAGLRNDPKGAAIPHDRSRHR